MKVRNILAFDLMINIFFKNWIFDILGPRFSIEFLFLRLFLSKWTFFIRLPFVENLKEIDKNFVNND